MLETRTQLRDYRKRYNSLSNDVEVAYDELQRQKHRLRTIRGALRIIRKYEAHDYLGLFLLHRHFDCPPDSVFVERRYTPEKGHAQVLVTQAEQLTTAPKRATAHRFDIGARQVPQPLEFTTDPAVARANDRLSANSTLSEELCGYIVESGFANHLGLGIFVRTGTSGRATSVFLEETNFVNRSSVVHILPRLPIELDRAIPTLWTVTEGGLGCCNGSCVAYCSHAGFGYCGHRKTGSHMVCV